MVQFECQALPREKWHILRIVKLAALIIDVLPQYPEPWWQASKDNVLNLGDIMGRWWDIMYILDLSFRHLWSIIFRFFIRLVGFQTLNEIRAWLLLHLCIQKFISLLLKKVSLVLISNNLQLVWVSFKDPLDVFNDLKIRNVDRLTIFLNLKLSHLAVKVLNFVVHRVIILNDADLRKD